MAPKARKRTAKSDSPGGSTAPSQPEAPAPATPQPQAALQTRLTLLAMFQKHPMAVKQAKEEAPSDPPHTEALTIAAPVEPARSEKTPVSIASSPAQAGTPASQPSAVPSSPPPSQGSSSSKGAYVPAAPQTLQTPSSQGSSSSKDPYVPVSTPQRPQTPQSHSTRPAAVKSAPPTPPPVAAAPRCAASSALAQLSDKFKPTTAEQQSNQVRLAAMSTKERNAELQSFKRNMTSARNPPTLEMQDLPGCMQGTGKIYHDKSLRALLHPGG